MFSGATSGTVVSNLWDVSRFFSDIMVMGLLMAIIFQFPIVLTLLIRFKILSKKKLQQCRLQVYCISVVVAILMPPQDLLSDVILTLPLVTFYEITLLLNRD
jgi:sec-independent protein translocase protein TatC